MSAPPTATGTGTGAGTATGIEPAALDACLLGVYPRPGFVLARGRGTELVDETGRAYLDFASGIGVSALGHADPEVVRAIQEQAALLGHVSNLYSTRPAAELAHRLCASSFAERVFFTNSGAEAVEAAWKFARRWAGAVHGPGKTGLVAFRGGFHGRTGGALALTAREEYQAPFRPLLPGVAFAPFGDLAAASRLIGPETAAVFVEPVQGEGGVRVAPPGFLAALRELCDRQSALLVLDEIQCGMGRTGRLWAHERWGVRPDLMTAAKALGGGLPLGAVLLSEAVAATLRPGDHGSTFGGNPIACRAARVVLERVAEPAFLARVEALGERLRSGLRSLGRPSVREVRGLGLMVGVELACEVKPVIEEGYRRGVLLLGAGPRVLRLLPPLVVGEAEIDRLLDTLREILP